MLNLPSVYSLALSKASAAAPADSAPSSSNVYVGLVGCLAHEGTVGSVSVNSVK